MLQLIYLPFSQSVTNSKPLKTFLGSSSTLELEKGALIGLRALHSGLPNTVCYCLNIWPSFDALPKTLYIFYYHECWKSIPAVN